MDVDLNSVPGNCCLNRLGTTNREVFGVRNGHFDLHRTLLVRTAVLDRYRRVCRGEVVADNLKVFIKQEPHKRKKLDEGRLRLIMSVSLVDALVDRVLFMKLMDKVVKKYSQTGVMIGWSPVNGGYRHITAQFPFKTISIDKKAWDWSVPYWLLMAVRDVILDLSPDSPEWWRVAVCSRFECLFVSPRFEFADGSLATQSQPGIMKSGCYLTIFINSVGQLILHEMAMFTRHLPRTICEPIVVVGDDSLQRYFDEYPVYVEYLTKLGFTLEVEIHESVPEFAGFKFCDGYIPAYREKHYFQLGHLTTERDIAQQTLKNYQVLYWFDSEMLETIRTIARMMGMPEAVVREDHLRAIALG